MSSSINPDEADLPEGSSGNEAIRAAAERAERTRGANIPGWTTSRSRTTPRTCGSARS